MKQQKNAVDSAADLIRQKNFFKTMIDNEEVWYYENGGGALIQLRWQFYFIKKYYTCSL
jgi:hypothetical protein